MDTVNILGVKINKISLEQGTKLVQKWLKQKGKHYIVTPNPEMVVDAQKDEEFKKIINNSDLAIPDSFRLGWAIKVLHEQNYIRRILIWCSFFMPYLFIKNPLPVLTGVDLMESLVSLSEKKAFRTSFLGGKSGLALKLSERLKRKYPKLRIVFADSEIKVNKNGETLIWKNKSTLEKKYTDILFVAFGHIKQEKWIFKNLNRLPVKVMMGVGGSFDYLSGEVPRAPRFLRDLGMEWLFRGVVQPQRFKRFISLLKFVLLVFNEAFLKKEKLDFTFRKT